MKKKWKIIFGAIIAIVIISLIFTGSKKELQADLLEVQPQSIAKTFKEEGKVVPKIEYPVYTSYSGKIINLPVKDGEIVKAGDLLIALDTKELLFQLKQLQGNLQSVKGEEAVEKQDPYQAQIKQQQLMVEQAEQDLKIAETNFKRIAELYNAGATSQTNYEDGLNKLNFAKNNLKQQQETLALLFESHQPTSGLNQYYSGLQESLKAQIDLIKYQIENSKIYAPIDGIVTDLSFKEGSMVNPQQPIMTVFQNNSYEIEVYVLTEDVNYVETGMKVELVQANKSEDLVFTGTVTKIAPSAEEKLSALGLIEQRIKVTIVPEIPKNLELRPGYALDVNFTIARKDNQLVVPKTALFPYGNGDALWVVRNGLAEIQPVITGFENDQNIVVTEGLKPGDIVVLNPQLEGIEEGKKVTGLTK